MAAGHVPKRWWILWSVSHLGNYREEKCVLAERDQQLGSGTRVCATKDTSSLWAFWLPCPPSSPTCRDFQSGDVGGVLYCCVCFSHPNATEKKRDSRKAFGSVAFRGLVHHQVVVSE